MTQKTYSSLLSSAFDLLSRRRYSIFELREKLFYKIKDESIVDQVISRLIELKYLDDTEFARIWIQSKNQINPHGKLFIIQELRKKGISPVITEKVFAEIDFEEKEALDRCFEKKIKILKSTLPVIKKKAKLHYFLTSRGFSFDLIQEKLAKIE